MGLCPRMTIAFAKGGPIRTASSKIQRARLLTQLPGLSLSPGWPPTTSGEQGGEVGSDLGGAEWAGVRCRLWDSPLGESLVPSLELLQDLSTALSLSLLV